MYCVAVTSANGVTPGICVKPAAAFAGGVGCHRPGIGGSTYGGAGAVQPSFSRHARISSATFWPTRIPCAARPGGIPVSVSASSAS